MNNYFCTNNGRDCDEHQHQDCCESSSCPCGEEFRRALNLLCDSSLHRLIDFNAFAFITNFFLLGTTLQATVCGPTPGDNLNGLNGTLDCGGDSCETIRVSGALYYPVVNTPSLEATVTQAVLCRLVAVAFDAAKCDDDQEATFQAIQHALSRLLNPKHCQECCHCSIAEALTNSAALRTVTLTAGPLLIKNATILGQFGDLLVLANSKDRRFYLVCADKITFLG